MSMCKMIKILSYINLGGAIVYVMLGNKMCPQRKTYKADSGLVIGVTQHPSNEPPVPPKNKLHNSVELYNMNQSVHGKVFITNDSCGTGLDSGTYEHWGR